MASVTLRHPDGLVRVEESQTGTRRLTAELNGGAQFLSKGSWETAYPFDLIKQILNIKGPAWVCDEIMRDEDPGYLQPSFALGILSYLGEESFEDCRILDFGCGTGASTAILGRIFPTARIVGVDIVADYVSIAEKRAEFHGSGNTEFLVSHDASSLPEGLAALIMW